MPLRIETVPLSNPPADGYRIRKQDYYLRDPGLDADELEALTWRRPPCASTEDRAWKRCGSSGRGGGVGR